MTGDLALAALGWALAAVLLFAVLAAVGLAARRMLLGRMGANIDCGFRRPPAASWRLGLISYQPDRLYWHNSFGVGLRPAEVFDRTALTVLSRRPAGGAEAASVGPGTVIVDCMIGAGDGALTDGASPASRVQLAMTEPALTGFLAWLEASPPGQTGLAGYG
jgi:Protein of unknown function (DUF2550)